MSEHSEETVRAELRAWLEANWDPGLGLFEWRGRLADSGWGAPDWPEAWYGRGLPVALGGTSNHFRRTSLVAAGGWDAWNVTEDADLGLRLARLGHRVGAIRSPIRTRSPQFPIASGKKLRASVQASTTSAKDTPSSFSE